jgi:hypothetical protein
MVLVDIPERECHDSPGVSACPSCGSPIDIHYAAKSEIIQSIEISQKKCKRLKVGSIAAFVLGLVLWMSYPESAAGPLISLGGLLVNLYASIGGGHDFD